MKIIITGAAGFIGSNLVRQVLNGGHQIIGIDNFSYGFERNIAEFRNNKNFSFVKGDLRDKNVFAKTGGDVIVHLASQKIPRYSNALVTLDDNYTMTKNVLEKCIQDKSKIVFASTSDVYGKNPNVPYSEESDLTVGKTVVKRWAYAISKIYGEHYIIANHDEYGLDYTITRFFGSYGYNQNLTWWGGPQSVFIAQALKNLPIDIHGDGKQTRTFTFIKDTVDGLSRCIFDSNASGQIFNIASEPTEEVTILDLGKLIWRLVRGTDSEPKINFIPYSTFGNYEDVLRRVPDISKIKTMLKYQPRYGLEEGLTETIKWQRGIND
jgi:UDP-glucose 4-epimerase